MDQSAFRDLLATPRAGGSSHATPQRARFGAPPPKRGTNGEVKEVFKKPDFKPRGKKFAKKQEQGGSDEEEEKGSGATYRNRALERRDGKEGDFAAAERLLEDFKARAGATDDKETIEAQMKYLGGDAEHSVLVKGLDFALLEKRKHDIATASLHILADAEAQLDQELAAAPAPAKKKDKLSRDEMLRMLKASRGVGAGVAGGEGERDDERLEEAKKAGRFVSIGAKAKGKGKEVLKADGTIKKRRKKVKTTLVNTELPSTSLVVKEESKGEIIPTKYDSGDDDIFGGIAEYKGDGSDSDEETKPSLSTALQPTPSSSILPIPPTTSASLKRSYFDDNDDLDLKLSTAPSSVTNLASNQSARTLGEEEESQDESGGAKSMRLEGFSGSSVLSAKDLLEMDKQAEKDEIRKAKKLKYGGGSGEPGEKREKAEQTEQQKANTANQKMATFLAKKEKYRLENEGKSK